MVTAKIIALASSNPFAAQENGVFPSGGKNHMFDTKVYHRFSDSQSMTLRYAYDNQKLKRTQSVSSDSNQIDEFSKTSSVIGEHNAIVSQKMVNAFRVHYYNQNVGNTVGLPHTLGRGDVSSELDIINALRSSLRLQPIAASLLDLDPFISIDGRVTKTLRLGQSRRLDLFFEVYNLTNHVNCTAFSADSNINSPSFLVRNGARDGRQAQWGTRFSF